MKRLYLCILPALLLASMLSGCSSAVTAGQPDPNTQCTPLIKETTAPPSQPSAAEDTFLEGSDWMLALECKIKHPTTIVGFLNEDFGITVGPSGEIHYSSDGGQTWPKASNSSMCRFCLDIVDENIAWAAGNGGNVRLSSDGGKTWTAVSDLKLNNIHTNLSFIDGTTGWIASNSELAGTSDGGQTWTEIPLPEGADNVSAICLRTKDSGYLLSCEGMLYLTADGGTTWNSQDLGFKNYDIVNSNKQPKLNETSLTALADISFADENNGTIVFIGRSPTKGYQTWCLTTKDGGAAWKSESISKTGFTPAKIFISNDGQFLTLSDAGNNTVVLKRK